MTFKTYKKIVIAVVMVVMGFDIVFQWLENRELRNKNKFLEINITQLQAEKHELEISIGRYEFAIDMMDSSCASQMDSILSHTE